MTEAPPELMDALWETAEEFGISLSVPDQVLVARRLGSKPPATLKPRDVNEAFARQGLRVPPIGYAGAVLGRWRRLGGGVDLLNVLLEYRLDAIDKLSGEYGGKRKREEPLRNNLAMVLRGQILVEARTAKGRTDILIPALRAVIEIKVWTARQKYEDGLIELGEYMRTLRPPVKQGFMVVFADDQPLPPIVANRDQAIAETRQVGSFAVPVIVIPFQVDSPSSAAYRARRRGSSGR